MGYYPLFIELDGKRCVVVGGGGVAERKVMGLLSAGAQVTVISPRITRGLKTLVKNRAIHHIQRGFRGQDLDGVFLVIGATSSKDTNLSVQREASRRGILVNIVDSPEGSNFIVPGVVRRGRLVVAVSTSGMCPLLTATLRRRIEEMIPEGYGEFVELLGSIRQKLLKEGIKRGKKDKIIRNLIDSPLLEWIKQGAWDRVDEFIDEVLGETPP